MIEGESTGGYFMVTPETEEYIQERLGEQFGVSPFLLMNLTNDRGTWAAVFFSRIIEKSDEVLKARGELRDEIGFAAYGKVEPGMSNPPIGAMAVKSAKALETASKRHDVFAKAWDALRSCSPDENWVALVDL
jgi:hypothetical protein